MRPNELSQQTTRKVCDAISGSLSDQERAAISDIIDEALTKSVGSAMKRFIKTAVACCGHNYDLADKISEEAGRARTALIANLEGMR